MLPFASTEFFILCLYFILSIGIAKVFCKANHYKYVLAILNAVYIFVFYPKPLFLLALVGYAYLFTWLFADILRPKLKIWGILCLLLPMLLVKLTIRYHGFDFSDWLSFAGLSYACFRTISFYMDKAPSDAMPNIVSYFNFLTFTPTLLIGPIDNFTRFSAAENESFSSFNAENLGKGFHRFMIGIAFKYIAAEAIDRYWLAAFPAENTDIWSMANNMYAYYFYLFFDFAGYSAMAVGIALMMGMRVPENFTNPFLAVNVQDFWQRFHITLGTWLRTYFFNPLYLFFTRQKSLKAYPLARQNAALMLTFILMGCWNGFRFHYLLSGFLFGLYAAIHNFYVVECKKQRKDVVFGTLNSAVVQYISIFITFNLVAIALYIFSGRCHL